MPIDPRDEVDDEIERIKNMTADEVKMAKRRQEQWRVEQN